MSKPLPSQKPSDRSVIQCPGCKTRFAIDSALLKLQDIPRFHCSKCDNVFAFDSSALQSLEAPKVDSSNALKPMEKPAPRIEERPNLSNKFSPPPPSNRPTIKQPELTEVLVTKPPSAFDRPTFPEVADQNQATSGYSGALKIPGKIGSFHRSRAPIDYVNSPTVPGSASSQSFGGAAEEASDSTEFDSDFQAAFDFTSSAGKRSQSADSPKASNGNVFWEQDPQSSSAISSTHLSSPTTKIDISSLARSSKVTSTAGLRAFGITAIPFCGFLALLTMLTLLATGNPSSTHDLILSLAPDAPVVPPAGLHIDSVKFKKVVLDDGESVYLISGQIKNSTDRPFGDVQVEGQAFDQTGQLVSKSKASAASNLATTRVKSLSLDMIKNLQVTREADKTVIQAGAKQDFAVAIPASVPAKVAYYSARIFSARRAG